MNACTCVHVRYIAAQALFNLAMTASPLGCGGGKYWWEYWMQTT